MKSIIQNCQLSDKILKGILNNDENVVNSIKRGVIAKKVSFLDSWTTSPNAYLINSESAFKG